MNREQKWVLITLVSFVFLYLAFGADKEGARHVCIFWTWFSFFMYTFAQSEGATKRAAHRWQGRAAPVFIEVIVDVIWVATYVWNGYIFMGIVQLVAAVLSEVHIVNIEAYKEAYERELAAQQATPDVDR